MPSPPAPSAMSADEFRALLSAAGLTLKGAASVLGVSRSTVEAWAAGRTSITAAKAALVRERLQPR